MSTYAWTPRVSIAATPIARYTHERGCGLLVDLDVLRGRGHDRHTHSVDLAAVAGGGTGRVGHGSVVGSRHGSSHHLCPQPSPRTCMHARHKLCVHTPSKTRPLTAAPATPNRCPYAHEDRGAWYHHYSHVCTATGWYPCHHPLPCPHPHAHTAREGCFLALYFT